METLVIDRGTPPDTLFSLLGVDRIMVERDAARLVLTPASAAGGGEYIDPDAIDPDDYPDTTAYLNAIPGMAESLIDSMNAPASDFKPAPRKFFHV